MRLSNTNKCYSLGIVGVRGFVARELLGLIQETNCIQVAWVSSRRLQGSAVASLFEGNKKTPQKVPKRHYFGDLKIENLSPSEVAERETDIVVLALPNGLSKDYVEAIINSNKNKLVIDLSADHRFDDSWIYSIPELFASKKLKFDRGTDVLKISNPGCYATAIQLALAPLINLIKGMPHCFGISGFSGAGTKPCANNDQLNLKNNILPYKLVEHLHEKEVSFHLDKQISFTPHVAEFFRGLSITIQIELSEVVDADQIKTIFEQFYGKTDYLKVSDSIPTIKDVVNSYNCIVGGFNVSSDGKRLSYVSCIDNLLKGAASQALQNIAYFMDLRIEKKLEY